jgi:drug/metabolite transporter, DME family
MSDFQLAVTLSLAAAVMFGTGAQFTRMGLRSLKAQDGALITIVTATSLYWLFAPWYLRAEYWQASAVWLFVIAGIFRPAISTTCAMAGTALLGATISTTVSSTAPFFGLLLGVLVLGEVLTVELALGTGAIILGVMLLAQRGNGVHRAQWPLWALALPLAAALIRACAHLLTKIGMEDVPSPYFAGLVSYTASLLVILANLARRRQPIKPILANPDTRWFVAAGVLFGAAVTALNTALQYGPLSVVAPLVSLEALVVLVLGLTVFREATINPRVIAAVLIVVAGTVVITAR